MEEILSHEPRVKTKSDNKVKFLALSYTACLKHNATWDAWRIVVHKDLSAWEVELKWYKLAQNRQAWRQLTAAVCT